MKPKGRQEMSILTFGSTKEKPQSCDIIEVGVHTKEGSPILLRLLSVPLICIGSWLFQLNSVETYCYLSPLDFADIPNGKESELLIGSDYYWAMVTGETVRGVCGGPVALQTRLGWILSVPITSSEVRETSANLITHVLRIDSGPSLRELDRTLKAFWELESLGVIDSECSVQEQFSSNIAFQNGQYEVCLPWKDPCASISDN